jgi:hypothetical protein
MTPSELAQSLLAGEPCVTGFYYWHLFTEKPVPARHDGETNEEYVRKNWWRLKGKVREWQESQLALP